MPSSTVIVVAHNSGEALTRCLASLGGADAIVVNNGDRGPEIDAASQRARVIDSKNEGFGAGCNRGAELADGEVLVFLNPDTVVQPGALEALARRLEDESIGVVQARLALLAAPDTLNSSGNVVHVSGLAWPGGYGEPVDTVSTVRDIPYASGAAFAIRSRSLPRARRLHGEALPLPGGSRAVLARAAPRPADRRRPRLRPSSTTTSSSGRTAGRSTTSSATA